MKADNSSKTVLFLIALALCASLVFGGCASSKLPPSQELGETRAAINQAEQVGARDYAPLDLREAKKKFSEAQRLSENEEYEKAKRKAEQAKIDAELAEAKTLSAKAQKAVRELQESIRLLQEEIERNQKNS